MRMTRAISGWAVVALGLVLVSGCTTDGGPDETLPSPSATATTTIEPTASSTPEPTATPADPPATIDLEDPTTWIIDFEGIGPLTVGGSVAAAMPAMLVSFTDVTQEVCPWVTMFAADGLADVLVPTEGDRDTATTVNVTNFVPDTEVSGPLTAAGIGVGSTRDELLAAYPGIVQSVEYDETVDYGLSDGAGRWIAFKTTRDLVNAIAVGPFDRVPSEFCG
jgi:hypothetical protein